MRQARGISKAIAGDCSSYRETPRRKVVASVWRILRQLHSDALERFWKQILLQKEGMNMRLKAIATFGLLLVLAGAANAQTAQTPRAGLPAPDNFLDIATFPL